jgi:hypothetical protein
MFCLKLKDFRKNLLKFYLFILIMGVVVFDDPCLNIPECYRHVRNKILYIRVTDVRVVARLFSLIS